MRKAQDGDPEDARPHIPRNPKNGSDVPPPALPLKTFFTESVAKTLVFFTTSKPRLHSETEEISSAIPRFCCGFFLF